MQIGDRVKVSAYKSDGNCYRWWQATVEAVRPDRVVVFAPVGHRLEGISGTHVSEHAIRTIYWLDRWYSLLEVYALDRELVEIYCNIGSPPELGDGEIRFTDYELDISRHLPGEARIVDEDEFLEAVSRYGYSEAFQRTCYEVAREALGVAERWVAWGMP